MADRPGDGVTPAARWAWRTGGLVISVAIIALVAAWQQHAAEERRMGGALFHGEAVLSARLLGHTEPLPALATRCSNCHEQQNRVPARAATGGASQPAESPASYALALNRDVLTTSRPRRGGPPSAYDNAAFCELLRNGVDPARVIIATEMPRYEVSDEQCKQIWAYLLSRR